MNSGPFNLAIAALSIVLFSCEKDDHTSSMQSKGDLQVTVLEYMEDGEPVEGTFVGIAHSADSLNQKIFFQSTLSDENGKAVFRDLRWNGCKKYKLYIYGEKEDTKLEKASGSAQAELKNKAVTQAIVVIK